MLILLLVLSAAQIALSGWILIRQGQRQIVPAKPLPQSEPHLAAVQSFDTTPLLLCDKAGVTRHEVSYHGEVAPQHYFYGDRQYAFLRREKAGLVYVEVARG